MYILCFGLFASPHIFLYYPLPQMIMINNQHCAQFVRLVFLMKQKGLDSSNCFRAVPPFNVSAPPMLLLWQTVLAKKRGGCQYLKEEWKAGAALGTENIQLLSPEPQQPSCNTDSLLLLQRLLDQILQRNNS